LAVAAAFRLPQTLLALATSPEPNRVDPIFQAMIRPAIVIALSIQALLLVVRDDWTVGLVGVIVRSVDR
jgi:multisubunit Na+/H+ antiporter MnhC subunit